MRNILRFNAVLSLFVTASFIAIGQTPQTPPSDDTSTRVLFLSSVRGYVEQRRQIEASIPVLPAEATPEQITEHKTTLLANVRTARAKSKQGEIFTPEAAEMFRRLIKANYAGAELADLRAESLAAENKGVPLKVNAAYPESRERFEMPPRLLLVFPELPEEVNYRFVGRHLLVMDKDSSLILDFMPNAIP